MKGGLKCDRMSWENLDFKLLQGGGGFGQRGRNIPIPIPLFNGSCLCFIFIARVYAILLNILPSSCPSRHQYTSHPLMGSHPPVPHHITLRYWELLLKLGKKVFIHKPVTNVLYPKCSGFFLFFLLLTVQGYELFRTGPS